MLKMQFVIVMGQQAQLWQDLPANESLDLNRHNYEVDERAYRATLDELTERLDLKGLLSVQVRRLSLGERTKMELAKLMMVEATDSFWDFNNMPMEIYDR